MNHWKLALHSLLYFSTKQFRMAILNEAAQMSSWHLADLLPIWNTPVTPLGLVGLWSDWRVTMVPQTNITDNRNLHRSIASTSIQTMVNFYNKENGPTERIWLSIYLIRPKPSVRAAMRWSSLKGCGMLIRSMISTPW